MDQLPSMYILLSRREDGRPFGGFHALGLTGALLAGLLGGGHGVLEDGRLGAGTRPPGDRVLADLWQVVRDEPKPRRLSWWLGRLQRAAHRPLLEAVAEQLVAAGAVRTEVRSFGRRRLPVVDRRMRDAATREVDDVIARSGVPDPGIATLVSLLVASSTAGGLKREGRSARDLRRLVRSWQRDDALPADLAAVVAAVTQAAAAAASG